MANVDLTVELNYQICPTCGIAYALPTVMDERRSRDGNNWYCPNGHSLHYSESEVQRLKKQLSQEREAHFSEQRRHEATQRELVKLKKRTAKGVCPCCQRSFVNMQRHMKTKHPEFPAEGK